MGKRTSVYLTDSDLARMKAVGRTAVQLIRDGLSSHEQQAQAADYRDSGDADLAAARLGMKRRTAQPYSKQQQAGRGKR